MQGFLGFFRKRPEEVKAAGRYEFIAARKDSHTVKQLCFVLKVSESGYYRWLKNKDKPSKRKLLSVEIKKILEEYPDNDNYGVNRIRLALLQKGIDVSRRTVYRAMAEEGLLHRRRRPHGITKASTEFRIRKI